MFLSISDEQLWCAQEGEKVDMDQNLLTMGNDLAGVGGKR
jgi:hypothetical protein